jgi:hypothetical protein
MKPSLTQTLLLLILITASRCGQRSQEYDAHDHAVEDTIPAEGNQALYDQVMAIHDEVMPKMNDIYSIKEELKRQITETTGLTEEKRQGLEASISQLDSASEGMMIWMRNFNPLPDSLGEDQAREYLENEMERVKGVRTAIYEALEGAGRHRNQ